MATKGFLCIFCVCCALWIRFVRNFRSQTSLPTPPLGPLNPRLVHLPLDDAVCLLLLLLLLCRERLNLCAAFSRSGGGFRLLRTRFDKCRFIFVCLHKNGRVSGGEHVEFWILWPLLGNRLFIKSRLSWVRVLFPLPFQCPVVKEKKVTK